MARFNTSTMTRRKTENYAGGEAYQETPEKELVSILLTSFVQDQFYRDAEDTIDRLVSVIEDCDPMFVAKAAIFARNEFGMRSITHIAAGEIARLVKGEQWTKDFINNVVYRPDDMTEILAYYMGMYGKPIPNCMKKGLASAFDKFDAYQLAKYKQTRQTISLVDVVNMTHAQAYMENEVAKDTVDALMNGRLAPPETWEVKLTQAGGDAQKKALVWHSLIMERKLGYFALLRNLRNIAEQSPQVLDAALEQLRDESQIKSSLVMPFRFLTAVNVIQQSGLDRAGEIVQALNDACELSLSNVPVLDGKTLIAVDCSGSMGGRPIEIASMFAAAIIKSQPNPDLMLFDNAANYFTFNSNDSLLGIADAIINRSTYGGTDFNCIFRLANKSYERIIILSDMQAWVGYHTPEVSFTQYRVSHNADPFIYSFDLGGYGTEQFIGGKVAALKGFSDKVFDIMGALEEDRDALIKHIIQTIDIV